MERDPRRPMVGNNMQFSVREYFVIINHLISNSSFLSIFELAVQVAGPKPLSQSHFVVDDQVKGEREVIHRLFVLD